MIDKERPDDIVLKEAEKLSRLDLAEFIRKHVATMRRRIRRAHRPEALAHANRLERVATYLENGTLAGVEDSETNLCLLLQKKLQERGAWG